MNPFKSRTFRPLVVRSGVPPLVPIVAWNRWTGTPVTDGGPVLQHEAYIIGFRCPGTPASTDAGR